MQLPDLIAGYVNRNVPDIPDGVQGTLIQQRGSMRLDPDKPWLPFTAEQTMTDNEVGFVWHARVRMAPLVTAVVEDAFENGHGRLDAKIWGLLSVAHGRGVDIDRGEAQRYLAELPWNPLALLNNSALQFEQRDDDTIRVWVFDPKTWVDLVFDAHGDIVGASTTTRTRGEEGPQPWVGRFGDYREFGGMRAPGTGRVSWLAPEGEFEYWRGEITSLAWC